MAAEVMDFDARAGTPNPWVCVRLPVKSAVVPRAVPGSVVEEENMPAPYEIGMRPTPREKPRCDHHRRAKMDCPADKESRTRRPENDRRIVVGNINVSRIDGKNLNITAGIHNVVIRIAPEIAIIVRSFSHPLHGVHDIRTLIQNGFPKLLRPGRIVRHHIQDGWEREQSQDAWIPIQVVCAYGCCESIAFQVTMLVSPLIGGRNLVPVSRSGEHLCEKRIGVQGDARD